MNPNDSAFPEVRTDERTDSIGHSYGETYSTGGLTKREYFAAKALQGVSSQMFGYSDSIEELASNKSVSPNQVVAIIAIALADALIKELEGK